MPDDHAQRAKTEARGGRARSGHTRSGRPGLSCRRGEDARGRGQGGQERDSRPLCRGLSDGPARQAAEHVPGLRVARVGLRMRRTASVLCGSACCVYGLTFTSHFYGARRRSATCPSIPKRWSPASSTRTSATRSMSWPIPNSTTRSWSPTSACRRPPACRCKMLPKEINGVRDRRHRRAGLRRADPRRGQGRAGRRDAELRPRRGGAGSGAGAARRQVSEQADRHAAGRDVPGRSGRHRPDAGADGLAAGPVVPTREWRELYAALDCAAVAAHASLLHQRLPRVRGGRPDNRRLRPGRARRHGRLAGCHRHGLQRAASEGRRREGRDPAR